MMNKILVAVDNSQRNQAVFEAAVSLAQTTGASLMLVHILAEDEPGYPTLPTYIYYPTVNDRNYELYQQKLEEYKQLGIEFLQDLSQKATTLGVETEYTQLSGNPGRIICDLAKNWSADLIIVGSRGLKGLKEMFLGSVSNYVTHHAPCSVLILRSPVDSQSQP
ncbi:UspA domain-containing protein [Chondrocystis sp. NIES-4102]|nr:UspA domain-containing protein [Chondrocystis sp. NIES-4102]